MTAIVDESLCDLSLSDVTISGKIKWNENKHLAVFSDDAM
jgi:hypothetical protein